MTTSPRADEEFMDRLLSDTLHDLIREQVIHRLGSPDDLLGVDVRPLWGKYFRVNVRAGAGFTSGRVADSYFLTTDDDGNILEASPAIVRRY